MQSLNDKDISYNLQTAAKQQFDLYTVSLSVPTEGWPTGNLTTREKLTVCACP